MADLFAARNHSPNWETRRALWAVIDTAVAIALRKAEDGIWITPLEPGAGKTTVYVVILRELATNPAFVGIPVLVALKQHRDIKDFVEELQLPKDKFAIKVGTSEETASLRAMGRTKENGAADTAGAQFVITTHAMIEKYADKGLYVNQIMPLWEGATYIDDNGKTKKQRLARRLWLFDESVVPYETLQLTADDLRASADVFERYEWSEPAEHTRRLAGEVATGTSQTAALPRFDWLGILSRISDLVLKYVLRPGTNEMALYEASGWPVRIHRDERTGENVVLLGRYKLPGGLRHAIIADGSAGFRRHYVELATHDRRIKWLPSSNKTYRNLRVLRMDIGAGKGAYGDPAKRKALVRAVVAAFKHIPPGEPLLVVHRKQFGAELQEEVNQFARAKGIASERLRFLTWGKHASTNEFAHIKNVLLVGLLQYPNKTNEGMVRANGKHDPRKPVPFAVLEEMRLGEIDHAMVASGLSRSDAADGQRGCAGGLPAVRVSEHARPYGVRA